jgi:nitrous oxide reductase accessory protein NosL
MGCESGAKRQFGICRRFPVNSGFENNPPKKQRSVLFAATLVLALIAFAALAHGIERFLVEHPFQNPQNYTDHERCDNCGMNRNTWARTRCEFKTSHGTSYTCSVFCVAVLGMKLNEEPREVRAADYLNPIKMLAAKKAFFVMGSSAPGTMGPVSTVPFGTRKGAVAFAARYGGQVVLLNDVIAAIRKEIAVRR